MKGNPAFPIFNAYGQEKMTDQWSAGGRIGVLVTPTF